MRIYAQKNATLHDLPTQNKTASKFGIRFLCDGLGMDGGFSQALTHQLRGIIQGRNGMQVALLRKFDGVI